MRAVAHNTSHLVQAGLFTFAKAPWDAVEPRNGGRRSIHKCPLASVVASAEHPHAPPLGARRAIPTLDGLGWMVAEHDVQMCGWLMRFMPSGLEWLEGHARLACHRQSPLASVVASAKHPCAPPLGTRRAIPPLAAPWAGLDGGRA